MRTVWFIEESKAEGYYPLVLSMLEGTLQPLSFTQDDETQPRDKSISNGIIEVTSGVTGYRVSAYGEAAPPEGAPPNSVAIFDFKDVITKYDQFCGDSGMATKRDLIMRAGANPNVIAMVFDVDTPGGDGHAAASVTKAAKNFGKPVISHVEGMGASAGMWLIAGSDEIFMQGKGTQVGSIGSYVELWNFAEYFKQKGIDVSRIYAPQSTLKNKAFEDALNKDNAAMKATLKQHVDFFINDVKEGRPNISSNEDIFKGAMFFTDEAIKNSLADTSGTLLDAITRATELSKKKTSVSFQTTTTMQLSKYPKALNSLVKKETITAEEISSVNKELSENGITSVQLVSNSLFETIQNDCAAAIEKKEEIATERDALQANVDSMTKEIETLKAEVKTLGGKAAGTHTAVSGKDESHVETTAEAVDYSKAKHNQEAKEMSESVSGIK